MKINYLTWLKKDLARESEEITLPDSIDTLGSLFDYMLTRGEPFSRVFTKRHVIFAETAGAVVGMDDSIKDARELSFFSPIVGG